MSKNNYYPNNEKSNADKDKQKRRILIIIAILLIACGIGLFAFQIYNQGASSNEDEKISDIVATAENNDGNSDSKFSENEVVQFNKMEQQLKTVTQTNDEAYSWIYVPDTNVNYPICQSKTDDSFYLRHSGIDKSWIASGAIYTECCNTTTFNDRVTVIYGHNGYTESMFTSLHKFEKSDFFNNDAHEYFYIYTSDSNRLKYQVISAFKYDDRHIMNSFDFQNNQIFEDFCTMIQNPGSANKNVRTELDKKITNDDKIVVLSTCITNQKSNRFLVCGVLVENEKVN